MYMYQLIVVNLFVIKLIKQHNDFFKLYKHVSREFHLL